MDQCLSTGTERLKLCPRAYATVKRTEQSTCIPWILQAHEDTDELATFSTKTNHQLTDVPYQAGLEYVFPHATGDFQAAIHQHQAIFIYKVRVLGEVSPSDGPESGDTELVVERVIPATGIQISSHPENC